jgi:hypothetical protein
MHSSVGPEWSSPGVTQEATVVAFALASGSCLVRFLCLNLFISGIDFYQCCKIFGWLRVHFIRCIMGHHSCSFFGTFSVIGTSLWWCWGSINLSS